MISLLTLAKCLTNNLWGPLFAFSMVMTFAWGLLWMAPKSQVPPDLPWVVFWSFISSVVIAALDVLLLKCLQGIVRRQQAQRSPFSLFRRLRR